MSITSRTDSPQLRTLKRQYQCWEVAAYGNVSVGLDELVEAPVMGADALLFSSHQVVAYTQQASSDNNSLYPFSSDLQQAD